MACSSTSECPASTVCAPSGACQTCTVSGGGDALATAVGIADAGATLYVCAGTYTGGFTITSLITIIGAGQGADGTVIQGGFPVVFIRAGTGPIRVTLERVRIQNGNKGVFIDSGRALTIRDCTVTGNNGAGSGVGIFNFQGTLLLIRCSIENNTAISGSFDGGGLFNTVGSATLADCLVQGNRALRGGGIFNSNNGGTVTLSGTRVTDNTATSNLGSGIFNVDDPGSTVTLRDGSTVCANHPTTDQCVQVIDPSSDCRDTCLGA